MAFRHWLLLIVTVNLLSRAPFLGLETLWNIDEGRIAEVAREMAVTGDWIVPRIGGEPFGAYPPLAYWLMAASGSFFGFNEFAMRLPGTLAGAALVLVAAFMARRLAGDRAGLFSAVVLATLPGFAAQQVICRGDVLMTLFSTLAFDRFLAFAEGGRRWGPLASMYGSIALAILAKGPLGAIIPALGAGVWMILRREWRVVLSARIWIGAVVMLAAVAPWYAATYFLAGPEFIRTNLLLENLNAFTSGFEHPRPPWYLAMVATYRLVPWIFALPFAWKVRRTPGLSVVLGWTAAIFALLSISSSKRGNYLTFLYPAFALSVGITVEALIREAPMLARRIPAFIGGGFAAIGIALLLPIPWKGSFVHFQDVLKIASPGMILAGVIVILAARWKGAVEGISAVAAALVVGVALQSVFIEPRKDREGAAGTAFCRRIDQALPPGAVLATPSRRELEGAYHFYLRRIVVHRSGGPGYYLGLEEDVARIPSGKVRVLDTLEDDRGRRRVFFEALP